MVETIGVRIDQVHDMESHDDESDESGSEFADNESDEGYEGGSD